jgi:Matrixin
VLRRSSRSPAVLALSALSLAAAFVAGCGTGPADPSATAIHFDPCQALAVVGDSGATADQLTAVGDGIGLWNRSIATRLFMNGGTPAPSVPALLIHFQPAGPPFHGLYDDQIGAVFINTDLDAHPRIVTIAHEIGHAFGLVHVSGRPSVMNPGNLTVEPTAEDVAAVAALWGVCPPP